MKISLMVRRVVVIPISLLKSDSYIELLLNMSILIARNVEATATSQEKINTLYENKSNPKILYDL